MTITQALSAFRQRFGRALIPAIALLLSVVVVASYQDERVSVAQQKATGLGAVSSSGTAWDSRSMWRQQSLGGFVADALNGEPAHAPTPASPAMASARIRNVASPGAEERKIVRSSRMELVVSNPAATSESIQRIAEQLSGYATGMDLQQSEQWQGAGVVIRVPATRFNEARGQIKKLAVRVSGEKLEASDVTREYADMESALRNHRAEEAQYLLIMRRAASVKDVLEVAEHLSDVRGEIDQAEGEFRYLSHQVDMASIEVHLRTESEARVLGIQWRPVYRFQVSFRNGVQNLVDYADGMIALVMKLPAVALWAATFVLLLRLGWRLLRWLWRRTSKDLLPAPQATPRDQG